MALSVEDRAKIFVHDLLNYESSEEAQARLQFDATAPFHMSSAYFSEEEVDNLTSNKGHSLQKALEDMLERKKRKGDYQLCTSHDIAPIMQQQFGIRKDFQKHPSFKKMLKSFNKTWQKQAQARVKTQS